MSTRSGKRIHSSFSEKVESVSEILKERKSRSKRVKEASGEVATDKKKNIVRRPSDDVVVSSNDKSEKTSKSVRKSRRHTLKELNIPVVDYEALNDRKSIRQSRRLQKEDTVEPTNVCIQESNVIGKQKKKNKKKRAVIENLENESLEAVILTKKKASKKKKKSNSFIVEELVTGDHNKSFNKSNVSLDSFHSAAGSPVNNNLKIEEKISKHRDRKESSSLAPYNSVENIKVIKKRTKKTEKDKYLETLINESVKLSASNESFDSSVNKKGENEDKDVNRCEKEISGTFKTKSKQKKSKASNFKNTHTEVELPISRKVHNTIEAKIHGIDLEKKTIDKEYNIDTSTSNFDSIFIPHVNETVIGLKSVSPLNNSAKKRRKSTFNNSTSNNRDTSITLLHECYKDISDNLTIKSKTQLDEITTTDEFYNTTGSEKPTQSKSKDATYEKINLSDTNLDRTFDKSNNAVKEFSHNNRRSSRRESGIKNSTYDKIDDSLVDTTFNKQPSNNCNTKAKTSRRSLPQDITGQVSTVLNGTYDKITKDDSSSFCNSTYDKEKLDTTFARTKDNIDGDNILNLNSKSSLISSDNTDNMTDMSEDGSRISIVSDDSRAENIVNTSPLLIESSMDESQLNSESILLKNTATPQNVEAIGKIITPDKQETSSDNNKTPLKREGTFTDTKTTPLKREGTYTELQKIPSKHRPILTEEHKPSGSGNPTTHLIREGTFTKESSDAMSPKSKSLDKTPSTRHKSTPSPGRTPFSSFKSGSKVRVALNVTHSLDKSQRRSSIAAAPPRPTRVMFRSPVDELNVVVAQSKGKVIKSNLKGSSKSFMFDDSALEKCESRKRSRTQDGAEDGAKRARTAGAGAGAGVYARTAGRTRTTSAAARLQAPAEAEATPPAARSDAKPRTKLPDFAALHRKQFSKMESLDECQRRHARRARALLTSPALLTPSALNTPSALITPTTLPKPTAQLEPTASLTPIAPKGALHRNNPKETSDTVQSQAAKTTVTQRSKEIDQKNQSYTRFGFKLNLDVNPFSVPAKTVAILPKTIIKSKVLSRQATLPSLAGTTHRKEAAKQAVMREKSFTDKRDLNRNQNRTVIKGVRTNRRFELQMKMRNID